MPKYSYKFSRITETMTVYEDDRTIFIAHDITHAVNKNKLFRDLVYKCRGVKLNKEVIR